MRKCIRDLIDAARKRWADRSQASVRKTDLPALAPTRPASPRTTSRRGRPVCVCGQCKACARRAADRHAKWLASLHGYVVANLGYPASTLAPGLSFCVRRRGGAKPALG